MRRLLLLLPLLFSTFASASTADAQQKLQKTITEVLAVADRAGSRAALAQKVRPVLQRNVSFETMAKRAVGPGWRNFSSKEQQQATDLFTTLIIRTYSNKFTPGEHPSINYRGAIDLGSGRVDVPSTMVYKGSHYSVTYRMEQISGWQITDVVIEGVSMIANYRAQLDAQFKRGGAAAVINSLNQSVSRP